MNPRGERPAPLRSEASERQAQAARPDVSTWLAANAGSGKTRVLTDRVARLLLAGVEPQRILCLTYTKAAAGEMQNRLFARLGHWAMLEETALLHELAELGEDGICPGDLPNARTLFARAIEAPGGLKIQTIHAFCSALLRRFPLEAGVSPQFTEIEDRAAAQLRDQIIGDFAEGPEAPLIDALARHLGGSDFEQITNAVVGHRSAFAPPLSRADLWRALGLPEGYDEARLVADVFVGGEADLIRHIVPALQASGKNDAKAADILAAFDGADIGGLRLLEGPLLYGAGAKAPFAAKIGAFPTKPLREGTLAPVMDKLEALMRRVELGRESRIALAAAEKSAALHDFARAFLPEYARRKQLHGWLDFDDLILKARALLTDPAVASWVLYRLDGGIDHILVDEAQDTSPEQWDVIERLAQEFTSGRSARSDMTRTIFVVGDKKQSIYSFQGADPDAFDRMQAEFSRRLGAIRKPLQDLELEYSFRSSPAILRLVDLVFEGQDSAGFRRDSLHRAFKADLPGRVDLWPVVEKAEKEDDRHWTDPVDRPGERHHNVILADRIATRIRAMIDGGETIPVDGPAPGGAHRRPVRAGDFLILVQRRSELFAEIIRACKAADLPIAGADRLKVGAELAVRDLGALLAFLATPEDDLSLATVLKSPLGGWSEQDLFTLAHHRPEGSYLWQALRHAGAEHPETLAMLHDLRDRADFLRPFELIERALTRHRGREKLLARLGPEAEDGIDALLSQALAYEATNIPSLTGFLAWMETDELEIKRQTGSAGDLLRVMTVHGAKGLEAPIVILPDTCPPRNPRRGEILLADGVPLWRMPADSQPPLMADAHEVERERDAAERQRLLYVAMTRAEKWLIVAAAGDAGKDEEGWYRPIEAAMKADNAASLRIDGMDCLRLSHGDWEGLPLRHEAPVVQRPEPLPDLFRTPAPAPVLPSEPVNPSDLGGAKALPGESGLDEAAAMLRGTRLHLLLEHLPLVLTPERAGAAGNLLPDLDAAERSALLAEAIAVLDAPALAPLFAGEALAEVALTAEIRGQRFHGVIDRLLVTPGQVLAVDFKSNALVPATPAQVPEGLLRQMGAYAAALAAIYPDHTVQAAILWTRSATLMTLPAELLSGALARATCLDGAPRRS
ncbi:double-strand break repair helicase AddA [Pontibaca methylaminivorans]|uniref:DNA 3'-5' helicase n=1 Tax=Pontibaca methylaminivorans TaxID=515897 RepID=A0A1R3WUB4_9RHOB|nr:DNA helicase/exodeoxyribonuclease V, subunit A [Pontibaca methylaminivorans]